MASRKVRGEHTCGQAECRVVGAGDRLFLGVEIEHGHHRAKDLFPGDGHVIGHIGKHGGRQVEPIAVHPRPARHQPRTFGLAFGDIAFDDLHLGLADHGAKGGRFIQRITYHRAFQPFGKAGKERLLDALLHKHPRAV